MQATLSAEVNAFTVPENSLSSEILASLSSLKNLLQGQMMSPGMNNPHFPQSHQQHPFSEKSLPPIHFVLALLKKVKGGSLVSLNW